MSPIRHHGSLSKTENFLRESSKLNFNEILNKYGSLGLQRLSDATPVDSGLTSLSWGFDVEQSEKGYKLVFTNTNIVDGVPVAILLQYGHGTRNGSFVEGLDYINPALKPIFEALSRELWKEVTGI